MAWVSNDYRMKIEIDLPNGVYTLGSESGSGKTYLAKWLKKLHGHNEPVYAILGDTEDVPESLVGAVPDGCKVFMFDEYTLYNGNETFAKELAEFGKDMVVLVDCKVTPYIHCRTRLAYVSFRDEYELYAGR